MSIKQRTYGQFETPPDVADLLLGFCLRRPSDRLMDPSCGAGAFLKRVTLWREWLADNPSDNSPDGVWGVELDQQMSDSARASLPQAQILTHNFFTLEPDSQRPFDAIIGNPPYTRAEWIGRLSQGSGQQLAFKLPETMAAPRPEEKQHLLPRHLWGQLDSRSGLHAYFFLHSAQFLREGGRLGFVVPNSWLDVAYGQTLKQFLLDHFRIMTIIESGVERWFNDAKVNTCLVVLEKCSGPERRKINLVRLIRLKQRLAELIALPLEDRERPSILEQIVTRLLPSSNHQTGAFGVRVITQKELDASKKWGLLLRAPTVYRRHIKETPMPPLKNWATVKRGFTTGANSFFYLTDATIKKWGIEAKFRRPILKSLRGIDQLSLTQDSFRHQVLSVSPKANLADTSTSQYIAWGESKGYHLRRTCASRTPWYSLQEQDVVHLVLPKGIWRRHFASVLDAPVAIDQQLYGVILPLEISPLVAAALLNSAWFALQSELQGRVNFGEGVLWLAAYETESIRLPDPRLLRPEQTTALAQLFSDLAQRPLQNIETELDQPDREALDSAVFDLMGFSATERTAVVDALIERVETRQRRART